MMYPTMDDEVYSPSRNIESTTLTDQVYARLREDIVSNHLPPGTRLQEINIADAFSVSRGPVREAIRRLSAEGLVDVNPRRGAVVNALSREEFLEAYQVREALESLAVRLADRMYTPEDLQALEDCHREMVQCASKKDFEGFFAANARFHSLLVETSKNKKLLEIYRNLDGQLRRYRMSSLQLRGGLERSCEEHQAILEAFRNHDSDEAVRLIGEHIHVPQKILESDTELEIAPVSQWSIATTPDEESSH